jgi:DNA-directed RNA polymerase specialized sigma24 family protein
MNVVAWSAFARIDTFVGGSFRGWLFTIAKNALISVVRKPSHRLRVAMPEGLDPVARDENSSEELHAALRDCLKSLLARGDVNVKTLDQVKLKNEEPQTVAKREGITATAVYGRVLRGLRAVGDCVKGKLS